MKSFNTAGTCFPQLHYMVNIDRQVQAAARLVRHGDYFCINRGRQYGKTTTLAALEEALNDDFCVFNISFEGLDDDAFASLPSVCAEFLKILQMHSKFNGSNDDVKSILMNAVPVGRNEISSMDFKVAVSELCNVSAKPLVILIDEVDQASNNDGFVKFLGLLRNMYLSRLKLPTFQSVILAGVYDVKNLKLKIRSDDDHQYNSPWNIAVPFNVSMSLPVDGISAMLAEYMADHGLVFDNDAVAQLIFDYTSGYPFLVSRICQIIDSQAYSWDRDGILNATHDLLLERNTLFDDLVKKLDQFPKLKDMMKRILFSGSRFAYNPDEKHMQIALMFNFVKVDNGGLNIACRLMETRLYNFFLAEADVEMMFSSGQADRSQFIHDGCIDMRLLLQRFSEHFNDIFRLADGSMDLEFVEKQGRKQFLLYLRPIINGRGNYYVEAETRDESRTDVVVDYLGQQYVIELKIWRGQAYNERGERQLAEYLDYFHLQTGYMLSFCFNKNKQPGLRSVAVGGRTIYEAVV